MRGSNGIRAKTRFTCLAIKGDNLRETILRLLALTLAHKGSESSVVLKDLLLGRVANNAEQSCIIIQLEALLVICI